MRVYPAADKEIVAVTEIEQFVVALFSGIASITGAGLVRNNQVTDEQCVRDDRSTEYAASL